MVPEKTSSDVDLKTVYAGFVAGGIAGAIFGLIFGAAGAFLYVRFNQQPRLVATSPVSIAPSTVRPTQLPITERVIGPSPAYTPTPQPDGTVYYPAYTPSMVAPVAHNPPESRYAPPSYTPPAATTIIPPTPTTTYAAVPATGPTPPIAQPAPAFSEPATPSLPPAPGGPVREPSAAVPLDGTLPAKVRFFVHRYAAVPVSSRKADAENELTLREAEFQSENSHGFLGVYHAPTVKVRFQGGTPLPFHIVILDKNKAGQACEGVVELEYDSPLNTYRFPYLQLAAVIEEGPTP